MKRQSLEIEEGLREWEATPVSVEGKHPELREEFHVEEAGEPAEREHFSGLHEEYLREHLDDLLTLVSSRRDLSDRFNELLVALDPEPRSLEALGLGYSLWEVPLDGEKRLLKRDHLAPHGRLVAESGVALDERSVGPIALFTLDFLGREIRKDTSEDSVRYYSRSLGRYLGTDDPVMDRRPDDLWPFFRWSRSFFQRVARNFEVLAANVEADLNRPGRTVRDEDIRSDMQRRLEEAPELVDRLIRRHNGQHLAEAMRESYVHLGSRIARTWGLEHDQPLRAYVAADVLLNESDKDMTVAVVGDELAPRDGVHSVGSAAMGGEIIYRPGRVGDPDDLREASRACHLDYLAKRAGEADPEVVSLFHLLSMEDEAKYSPELLSLGTHMGVEWAMRLLVTNPYMEKADHYRLLRGHSVLRRTGIEFAELPLSDLTHYLLEAQEMKDSGIWDMVTKADPQVRRIKAENMADPRRAAQDRSRINEAYADCYERGARILRRARKARALAQGKAELEGQLPRNDWSLYDYEIGSLPDDEVLPWIAHHTKTLTLMVGAYLERVDPDNRMDTAQERRVMSRMIESVVLLGREGFNPREFLVAYDKYRYAQRVIDRRIGSPEEEIDWITRRFPGERLANLRGDDLVLITQNERLIERFGPHPAVLLADWRSLEGADWHELTDFPAERMLDLELQLAIADSDPEDRTLVREAVEAVGWGPACRLYERFFDSRITMAERYGWARTERDIPAANLKEILDSLRDQLELRELPDLLGRYRRSDDPFFELRGWPASYRELRSRLSATPEEIARVASTLRDKSPFVQQRWLTALDAPGMDYRKLHDYLTHPEFKRLIDGELDREMPFKPVYSYYLAEEMHETVAAALGSVSRGEPGKAARPKKLYHDLKQFLRRRGLDCTVAEFVSGPIPTDLHEEIFGILQRHERHTAELIDYAIAQIHYKRDPAGWVSGNYTECCIPFGRSLNNDYMLNPAAQYFTVSHRDRIVAQSVVVDAIDRRTGRRAVVLDSIEIAKRYQGRSYIESIYRSFWGRSYPNRTLLVGAMNGDPKLGGTKVDAKRFEPRHPLAYTDAWRHDMYEVQPD